MVEINALFFDLFGVLLGIDQSTIIHYVAKKTDTSYLLAKKSVLGENFINLERNDISFKQYFSNLQHEIKNGDRLNYDDFKIKWINNKIDELPSVNLLKVLSEKFQLYIISNTNENHVNNLKKQFNFLYIFDDIITSEAAGNHKPNQAIFKYALHKTNCLPESSIFIDDSLSNTIAANKIGFYVHHYKNFESFNLFLNNIT